MSDNIGNTVMITDAYDHRICIYVLTTPTTTNADPFNYAKTLRKTAKHVKDDNVSGFCQDC